MSGSTTARYIARSAGRFLTNRKPTGRMYENRVQWSKSIDDAKVFQTSAAASNSANRTGVEYTIETVTVSLGNKENGK